MTARSTGSLARRSPHVVLAALHRGLLLDGPEAHDPAALSTIVWSPSSLTAVATHTPASGSDLRAAR
jgi:hypothetical protein